jgi:hypothetical protein
MYDRNSGAVLIDPRYVDDKDVVREEVFHADFDMRPPNQRAIVLEQYGHEEEARKAFERFAANEGAMPKTPAEAILNRMAKGSAAVQIDRALEPIVHDAEYEGPRFVYATQHRPPAWGGAPSGRIVGADKPHPDHKFGTIEYPRKLTPEQVKQFQLKVVDEGNRLAVRAWHGTPHEFERFDLSKIGTGEGAQAYGHGLYFSETEAVARQYRNKLEKITRAHNRFLGVPLTTELMNEWLASKHEGKQEAARLIKPHSTKDIRPVIQERVDMLRKQRDELSQRLSERLNTEPGTIHSWTPEMYQDRIDALNSRIAGLNQVKNRIEFLPEKKSGRLYEVELAGEKEDYLDWDVPLDEQSEKVQKALEELSIKKYEKQAPKWVERPEGVSLYVRPSQIGGRKSAAPSFL